MQCYVTNEKLNMESTVVSGHDFGGGEMKMIKVFPDCTFQDYLGMGGAFTEAAAYNWSKMSSKNQEKLVSLYFDKEGSDYNFCRCHIQSCDFALGNYAYVESDENFDNFNIDRDKKYIIPLIKKALEQNKQIEFLASPWSPPAFMKTNGEMNHGGKLKKEYYQKWAQVVCKYILAYEKEGIKITRLTVQNEPEATQSWDSCRYTAAEEREYASDYLKPELEKIGKGDIKINVWDHNKELLLERARECLSDDKAKKSIDGIAFHWYSGDHFEQIAQVKKEFPDKELIFTEGCVEYSRYKSDDQIRHAQMYAHDIIGDFNAGANAFIDWNLYLDMKGGPNHVGNFCDAPIMCDTENDTIKINKSYYYISHFSKFIKKGAKRILLSKFTSKIEGTAFINPDGSKVVVLLNPSDDDIEFTLYNEKQAYDLKITNHSIMTLVY